MSEALPRGDRQLGGKYPEVPDVMETLRLLGERYCFRISGASWSPMFKWVERRREVLIPQRSVRYVVELHVVLPHLNVHIIHVRARWEDEGKVMDRVEFRPWALYPGNVKDFAFGRWEYDN